MTVCVSPRRRRGSFCLDAKAREPFFVFVFEQVNTQSLRLQAGGLQKCGPFQLQRGVALHENSRFYESPSGELRSHHADPQQNKSGPRVD